MNIRGTQTEKPKLLDSELLWRMRPGIFVSKWWMKSQIHLAVSSVVGVEGRCPEVAHMAFSSLLYLWLTDTNIFYFLLFFSIVKHVSIHACKRGALISIPVCSLPQGNNKLIFLCPFFKKKKQDSGLQNTFLKVVCKRWFSEHQIIFMPLFHHGAFYYHFITCNKIHMIDWSENCHCHTWAPANFSAWR